jgi:hypothetical protein
MKRKPLPKIWPPLAVAAFNVFALPFDLWAILDPGHTPMNAAITALHTGLVAFGVKGYRSTRQRRQDVRRENFQAWLQEPVPPTPAHPITWEEFETEVERMLQESVDPLSEWVNYDYIVERIAERKRLSALEKQYSDCAHTNTERFVCGGWKDWVCTDCGKIVSTYAAGSHARSSASRPPRNPFRR